METRPDYRAPSLPFISSFPFPSFPSHRRSSLRFSLFFSFTRLASANTWQPAEKSLRLGRTIEILFALVEGHVDAPRIKGRFSASSLSFLSYSSLFFSRRFVFFFFFTSFFSFIPPTSAFCKHGDTATGIPKRPEKYSLGAVQVDSIDVTKPPTIR